mmetsp:Transcript_39143/g.44583  ORF Transcript_39143/g.44583 Transcript_39143/m.44583 type:complete len:214 (+) Transcript_39143:96-737(+)
MTNMVRIMSEDHILHVLKGGYMDCRVSHGRPCLTEIFMSSWDYKHGFLKSNFMANLIPWILYKRRILWNDPVNSLISFLKSFCKTNLFLMACLSWARVGLCSGRITGRYHWIDSAIVWLPVGLSLLFEPFGRRVETDLYLMYQTLIGILNKLYKAEKLNSQPEILTFIFFILASAFTALGYHNSETYKGKVNGKPKRKPTTIKLFEFFLGKDN